jgi:hypothetical protein
LGRCETIVSIRNSKEKTVVTDTRTNVFVVRDSQCIVAVWGQVYKIDRHLQPEERECRLLVRIHRGERGAPILLTKRGRRSSFLTGKTWRRFEIETGLQIKAVELRDLDSRADGEFGRKWAALNAVERLRILEWIAEG